MKEALSHHKRMTQNRLKVTARPPAETMEALQIQLEQAQKDMEELAYAASHDLQAPMRHVGEFAQLLIKRLTPHIGEEEQKFVRIIEKEIRTMGSMLTGMRDYSRLNTMAQPFTEVDCNELLQHVLAALKRRITEHRAEIECGNLPLINGDEGQLHLLFYHLLDNAIKFHREEVPPNIKVTAEQKANEWVFHVQDNGVGIDEKQQEAVFQIFRRLDKKSNDDVGIGLALCKKVVNRHLGHIWITSAPQNGTIVSFALPYMELPYIDK